MSVRVCKIHASLSPEKYLVKYYLTNIEYAYSVLNYAYQPRIFILLCFLAVNYPVIDCIAGFVDDATPCRGALMGEVLF